MAAPAPDSAFRTPVVGNLPGSRGTALVVRYPGAMLLADGDVAGDGAELAWVCHGCHARYDEAQKCCPATRWRATT